jgi:hypothetical protein
VNRPAITNSAEWKSPGGQDAMMAEVRKHEKKGTWNNAKVKELSQLLK